LTKFNPRYVRVFKSLPWLVIETHGSKLSTSFLSFFAILCAKISSVYKPLGRIEQEKVEQKFLSECDLHFNPKVWYSFELISTLDPLYSTDYNFAKFWFSLINLFFSLSRVASSFLNLFLLLYKLRHFGRFLRFLLGSEICIFLLIQFFRQFLTTKLDFDSNTGRHVHVCDYIR